MSILISLVISPAEVIVPNRLGGACSHFANHQYAYWESQDDSIPVQLFMMFIMAISLAAIKGKLLTEHIV